MKYSQIISEAQLRIPLYSDLVTINYNASISVVSNVATVDFGATEHGLEVNDSFSFNESIPLNIVSASESGGIVTLETEFDHDITIGFNSTITLSGFDAPALNGEFEVNSIPDRNFITIKSAESVLTGSPMMSYKSLSKFGGQKYRVDTVVSPFVIESTIDIHDLNVSSATIKTNPSVQFALSDEDAEQAYTSADRDVVFYVIPDDVNASKDSRIDSDHISVAGPGVEFRYNYRDQFHCLAFFRLSNYSDLLSAVDEARNEFFFSVCKAICGYQPSSPLTENYRDRIKLIAHYNPGLTGRNRFYVHRYDFEHFSMMSPCDTQDDIQSVNANDIELNTRYNNRNIPSFIELNDD